MKTQSRVKLFPLYAGIACLFAGIAWSQATNSADVTGSVTDPTGGVVPGVTVTVKDIDKNTERTYVTNASGLYDTGPLVPSDQYLITFKREGFATVQRGPMTLRSGVTGLNIQLTLGQSTQQISIIESGAPLLETTTAEISQTVPQETLKLLPQTGGIPDWQSFLTFLPGTRGNGTNNSSPGMGGVSVNGSMPFSNALLDGASTSSPMSNNVINTPIFDTLGEVKMSSSAFSAQYGGGGMVYNQISKGGSNQFHGMAYDYFKNSCLECRVFWIQWRFLENAATLQQFRRQHRWPGDQEQGVLLLRRRSHDQPHHAERELYHGTDGGRAFRQLRRTEPDLRSDHSDRQRHAQVR